MFRFLAMLFGTLTAHKESREYEKRRRIPLGVKWAAGIAAVAFVFRKALAFLMVTFLSVTLGWVGFHPSLPHLKFGWPWTSVTAGVSSSTDLGPWVVQKIEGISRPALGQANFQFYFTHKVSKNIGPWPCWYSATFYAVGHASSTVNLNPGPSWWKPVTGHLQLTVVSKPSGGRPGHVRVLMVLPPPQLPTSAHQVVIDNLPSTPLDSQHSWTYPGLGCGVLLRPQFAESVLYAQAQEIAFYKATHSPWVTAGLTKSAEAEAVQIIRNNFIQPTVNALGYDLDTFVIQWEG